MLLSEHIAQLIEEMLEEGKGTTNVRRNDLAARLGCVPSQVSYVISSRFTPERGYITESRRGGGGYIKIVRVPMSKSRYLMHFFHAVGSSVSEEEAKAFVKNLLENDVITPRESALICGAVSGSALEKLQPEERNTVRADIMRHILMTLMS